MSWPTNPGIYNKYKKKSNLHNTQYLEWPLCSVNNKIY